MVRVLHSPAHRVLSSAQRALNAAVLALGAAGLCLLAFLPPLVETTIASVPLTVLTGIALAAALLLHWVFVGITAHRMHRSKAAWVSLSVLLFPIGSVVAVTLLGWLQDEPGQAQAIG